IRIVPAVEQLRVGIWVIPVVELLRVPKQGVLPPLSWPLCVRPVLSPLLFLLTRGITAAREQIRNSVASTSVYGPGPLTVPGQAKPGTALSLRVDTPDRRVGATAGAALGH